MEPKWYMKYNRERVREIRIIYRLRTMTYGFAETLKRRKILGKNEVLCTCLQGYDSDIHVVQCQENRLAISQMRRKLDYFVDMSRVSNEQILFYNQTALAAAFRTEREL